VKKKKDDKKEDLAMRIGFSTNPEDFIQQII